MKKRTLWIGILIPVLVLSLTSLNTPSKYFNTVQAHFEQMRIHLQKLKEIPQQELAIEHFDQLRQHFKALEWTLLPFRQHLIPEEINSSKYWVWQDQMFQKNYAEAGLLQVLEKLLESDTLDHFRIRKTIQSIDVFIDNWENLLQTWQPNDTELICAIAIDLQQQYLLTLSGQDRLASDKSLPEFLMVLQAYQKLLNTVASPQIKTFIEREYLSKIADKLQEQTFDLLDRVDLYKNHILPATYELLRTTQTMSDLPPSWASHLNLTQPNIFLKGGLNSGYFSELADTGDMEQLSHLGKLLFFDPLLSANNKRSCASCHKPSRAFSDGRQTSMGYDISKRVLRNSPSLLNSTYNLSFSHDMAKADLSEQIISVIYDHQEFRSSTPVILQKLNSSPNYQSLFATAFPNHMGIDSSQVFMALIAYMEELQDFDSPFDLYMQGSSKQIDQAVVNGYNLFMGKAKCGSCHFPPLYGGLKPMAYQTQEYHSHGVSAHLLFPNKIDPDPGLRRKEIKNDTIDNYKYIYKTPSLRNIAITGPYMHNGIFPELAQVLDYIFEGQQTTSVDASIPAGSFHHLSEKEKKEIQQFLISLTTIDLSRYDVDLELPITDDSIVPANRRAGGVY